MGRTDRVPRPNRRQALAALFAAGCGALGGCGWDGHFTLFGYSTKGLYDDSIKTVHVPIFRNKAFQTGPLRGREREVTRAVIRAIETRTPYKVVSDPDHADTELLGTLLFVNKQLLNRDQLNEVREMELTLGIEVVWRDLRDGRILTNRKKARGPVDTPLPPFDPNNPPLPEGPDRPVPVLVQATGRGLPEAGESYSTALQMAIDRAAVQVTNLMEVPWNLDGCK